MAHVGDSIRQTGEDPGNSPETIIAAGDGINFAIFKADELA